MSALGQKQTSRPKNSMSALPPRADIVQDRGDVRFVPKADHGSRTSTPICDWQNELKRRAAIFTVGGRGKFTAMIFNDHSTDGQS
jgi:hypothetical protein